MYKSWNVVLVTVSLGSDGHWAAAWSGLARGRHFVEWREAGGFVWDRCWARAEASTGQSSAVECAAAAWAVLPCQCVFGLFLTTSLIITRSLPISPRPPAAAQWKHHSRDTVSLCHAERHGAALHEAWAGDGQLSEWTRVIWSAALAHSAPQQPDWVRKMFIFSKLESSGPGPQVIKCASNNKMPPTRGMCAELRW